jgi:hypothetical protein
MRNYRPLPLLLAWAICITALLKAQALQPQLEGALLHVAAPQLHFLSGRVLEKLHDGAAVPLQFELAATSGGHTVSHTSARFVLSYDLWEERLSVLQTDGGDRSASHLNASAAEAWCLENLSLAVSALAGEKMFVLKLDIRAEETKGAATEPGPRFSMAALIDVFSRRPKEEPLRWSAVSRPIRFQALVRK